jgi:hypothetical protein
VSAQLENHVGPAQQTSCSRNQRTVADSLLRPPPSGLRTSDRWPVDILGGFLDHLGISFSETLFKFWLISYAPILVCSARRIQKGLCGFRPTALISSALENKFVAYGTVTSSVCCGPAGL